MYTILGVQRNGNKNPLIWCDLQLSTDIYPEQKQLAVVSGGKKQTMNLNGQPSAGRGYKGHLVEEVAPGFSARLAVWPECSDSRPPDGSRILRPATAAHNLLFVCVEMFSVGEKRFQQKRTGVQKKKGGKKYLDGVGAIYKRLLFCLMALMAFRRVFKSGSESPGCVWMASGLW